MCQWLLQREIALDIWAPLQSNAWLSAKWLLMGSMQLYQACVHSLCRHKRTKQETIVPLTISVDYVKVNELSSSRTHMGISTCIAVTPGIHSEHLGITRCFDWLPWSQSMLK